MISQTIVWVLTIFIGIGTIIGVGYVFIKSQKKKNKFKRSKAENKESISEDYKFRVTIADPIGPTIRDVDTFGASKTRDDNRILMLTNNRYQFNEYFPSDEKHEVPHSLENINKVIKDLKEKQLNLKDNENPLNIKSEILKWEKIKKLIEFDGGSFIKFDKDGTPHFIFVRYRSIFVPFKWNLDLSHVHASPEPFSKNIIDAREEKRKKYTENKTNIKEIIVTAGMLFMVIFSVINAIWSYNLVTWSDDNNLAQLQKRIDMSPVMCAELYAKSGENFFQASQNAVTSTANAIDITIESKKKMNEFFDNVKQVPVTNIE